MILPGLVYEFTMQPATHQCRLSAPEQLWLVLQQSHYYKGKATHWFCNIRVNRSTLEQLDYE